MSRRSRSLGLYRTRIGLELPSLIKSIQRGTIAVTTPSLSNTATITAVNMDRSRLRYLSLKTTGGGANAPTRLTLTNATTITANRSAEGGQDSTVSFEVTEYQPGVLKSVQRGTITLGPAANSNTATITAVNMAKTELNWLGLETDDATGSDQFSEVVLTNATTITATRITSTGTTIISYEVVEWF